MTRSDALKLMAGAALWPLVSCNAGSDFTSSKKPNILLIAADDLGYGDLGIYGGEIPTPNLDRLCRSGVKFTDFYATAPACTPSRFSLLTGQYPTRSRHGLQRVIHEGMDHFLDREHETTLASYLKSAGYRTGISGKWHLGDHRPEYLPMNYGFDYFSGTAGGAVDYYTHTYAHRPSWWINNRKKNEEGYSTDLITNYAIDFINQSKESPFFLYLAYNAPHTGKTDAKANPPGTLRVTEYFIRGVRAYNTLQAPPEYLDRFKHIEDERRRYFAAMVASLDANIGRVLEYLEKNNLTDNTLIWFVSDNGGDTRYGSRNAPLRGRKQQLFEGGVRVPSFISWKGKIKPGAKSGQPACLNDVLPTIAPVCGIPVQKMEKLDGIDLWPAVKRNVMIPRNLYFHYSDNEAPDDVLRRGDWKALRENGVRSLYNLKSDISESKDLAEQHPDIVESLMDAFDSINKSQ